MNLVRLSFYRHFSSVLLIGLLALTAGCDKDEKQGPTLTAPLVITVALTNVSIGSGTATTGGSIVSDGGDMINAMGIVWSQSNAMPTLYDSVIEGVGSSDTFTTNITGLDFDNTYYFRAFATNSVGTGYGSVVTLTTSADSVRFTYNGEDVVYGVIVSSASGKRWLDRNLGANRVATAFNDYEAYGDFFQWGRPDDGHQLINWTASNAGTAVNGTTNGTAATSDNPENNNFIIPPYDFPLDWRSDNNRNRWVTTPQGPCPNGWHVPTIDDWMAEVSTTAEGTASSGGMTESSSAFSQLKLTIGGYRNIDGPDLVVITQSGRYGNYWSASDKLSPDGYSVATLFKFGSDGVRQGDDFKANGRSVRCIKD